MALPDGPNQRWSLDYAADTLNGGQRPGCYIIIATTARR